MLLDLIPHSIRESRLRFLITESLYEVRGRAAISRARRERLKAVGPPLLPSPAAASAAEVIEAQGFVVVPNVVSDAMLDSLAAELEERLDSGTRLNRISNDRTRSKGDIGTSTAFLSEAEVAQGQALFRDFTNFASVRQPFLDCPAAIPLAFLPLCDEIAAAYLGARGGVGGANLRKSFVNDIPEFDTLLFHVDPNSPKFLKFFFYLHNVGPGGGAFCYLRGSHRRRFLGWTRKYRWTRQELLEYYAERDFVEVHAKKGDLIVADTNGFHAGMKATAADRSMLTVDYLLHKDFYAGAELSVPERESRAAVGDRDWVTDFLAKVL